jgi:hypothetical protein
MEVGVAKILTQPVRTLSRLDSSYTAGSLALRLVLYSPYFWEFGNKIVHPLLYY